MMRNSYVGREIGNYRIVSQLASGAFGSVYKGKHTIFTNRPVVAIKLLHTHLSSQEDQDRFFQEARLLEMFKHPNILPIIDAGIHEGFPYLIVAYASGGSLRDRLQRQPSLPISMEEAITILSQIGHALHYAHQQHIIHRDIKPENILFNEKGDALLADFGIATVLTTASAKQTTILGTPSYMAPEQFRGIISSESDQYALGCIVLDPVTWTQNSRFSVNSFGTWGLRPVGTGSRKRNVAQKDWRREQRSFLTRKTSSETEKGGALLLILSFSADLKNRKLKLEGRCLLTLLKT